jgi:hypothetical protein
MHRIKETSGTLLEKQTLYQINNEIQDLDCMNDA